MDRRTREIIEDFIGDMDDMVADKRSTFTCAVERVFQAALPFQGCPAGIIILCKFREDRFEINLTVT